MSNTISHGGHRRSAPLVAPPLDRRSILRGAGLTALALTLAIVAAANATVQITQTRNPGVALAIDHDSGIALASAADRRWSAGPTDRAIVADAARLAGMAQREQAWNPRALRILGFSADAAGDRRRAERLMTLSARLDSHDLATQIWLIEAHSARGDLAATLAGYDTALRTRPEAAPILFPILAQGLSDPQIGRALGPYIQPSAPWMAAFIRSTVESGTNLGQLALLLARYGPGPSAALRSQMLNNLAASSQFAIARRYYLSLPGASAGALAGTAFDAATTDPSFTPITWQPMLSGGASVAFEPNGSSRRLHASIVSGESQVVAQKLLMLALGTYRLQVAQQFVDGNSGGGAAWRVDCATAAGARAPVLQVAAGTSSAVSASFTIPTGCVGQYVMVSLDGGRGETGAEFYVDRVTVQPAAAASTPQ